jgi:hypothetical protein
VFCDKKRGGGLFVRNCIEQLQKVYGLVYGFSLKIFLGGLRDLWGRVWLGLGGFVICGLYADYWVLILSYMLSYMAFRCVLSC